MAKDKERSLNPAQAQRKADKAKALKRARNEQQTKRNEKLARRNPDRIQRQIDDLKALEASGEIKPREQAILADLERDLKAVHKAKELLGPKASSSDGRSRQSNRRQDVEQNTHNSVLGKRHRDGYRKTNNNDHAYSSGSETDESVRNIPMPRDTPPPAPRNPRYHQENHRSGANALPLPPKPFYEAKTTYSSAPQLRDLKKEATSKFVPDIVRRKQDAVRGQGGLLEPEELDQLEKEGYYGRDKDKVTSDSKTIVGGLQDYDEQKDEEAKRLQDEEARFEKELAESMDVDEVQSAEAQPVHDIHTEQKILANSRPESKNGEEEEEEDDDDEDDYLPPSMSGKSMFNKLPPPQSQNQQQPVSFPNSGNSIAANLFSKLPKPKTEEATSSSRHVQMEDVEDEDL